jgi:predicted phage-related endonuclease
MTIEPYAITDRATWLAMRTHDLTASDLGAAAGADPYRPRLRVWLEKAGKIAPEAETPIMRRGRWLEHAAIAAFREQFPLLEIRYPAGVYLRDTEVRLGGTPDALAEDPEDPGRLVNIQLKVVARPVYDGWPEAIVDGETVKVLPLNYHLQTLAEGYLLNARRSILAALVIDTYGAMLEPIEVPRYPAAEDRIRQLAVDFWQSVRDGRQPVPDYGSDADTIAAMYPHAEAGTVLDLSADNRLRELLPKRAAYIVERDLLQDQIDRIEGEVKAKLGQFEVGLLPGWRITWKDQQRKGYTVQPSSSRPLRITQKELVA